MKSNNVKESILENVPHQVAIMAMRALLAVGIVQTWRLIRKELTGSNT